LSDNKQQIKVQTTVGRRRITYSQETLPSVEQQIVTDAQSKLVKSYLQPEAYQTAPQKHEIFNKTNFANFNPNYHPKR
jgi:hypothetical protein